jgi:hypothetical protein
LAEVLELSGRVAEAATAARGALELFEAKGNLISAARFQAGAGGPWTAAPIVSHPDPPLDAYV